jgi:hypothetical protein
MMDMTGGVLVRLDASRARETGNVCLFVSSDNTMNDLDDHVGQT